MPPPRCLYLDYITPPLVAISFLPPLWCKIYLLLLGGVQMTDKVKKFTLRMPQELWDKLSESAERNFRPVSKEILAAVNEYLDRHSGEE